MSSTADITSLLVNAAVPAFKCPEGTKMHFLNLGTLECDESWCEFFYVWTCPFPPTTGTD